MPRLSKIGAAALGAFGWTSGSSVTASYLVVAGGGGGAYAGGGGAGGYRESTISLNPTLSYAVTVGAGGAGETAYDANSAKGSDSVFSTITSTGGGAGVSNYTGVVAKNSGGSGGGAGFGVSGSGSGNTPSTSPSQGNNGGTGNSTNAGGGGGASAAGGNATATFPGFSGNGGAGTASSISGSSVTYAGGGGGGCSSTANSNFGTGGAGGGGSSSTSTGSPGTANTGGGGGGGSYNGTFNNSGAGGSGIVIISYVGAQQFGGGVVTSSGGNTIHTFTTSGTLSPLNSLTANFLVVAGGGGGATAFGAGGGAGGLRSTVTNTGGGGSLESTLTIDTNSIYLVTVGAGGNGATASVSGTNGSNSSFLNITSIGGGTGGNQGAAGSTGGSGGAGGNQGGISAAAGAGTANQGFAGGTGSGSPSYGSGGGGGAGAIGGTGTTSACGNGGAGVTVAITGSSVAYAGGGGGGATSVFGITTPGNGGNGGGGKGADSTNSWVGYAGSANTGGGGGGGGYTGSWQNGGAGGSGVVIISYPGSTQQMAGGTVTVAGGNVIHTFTSSGYLTPIVLVNNSLRFRGGSVNASLTRTPSVTSNRRTWTWSGWIKLGSKSDGFFPLFGADANGYPCSGIALTNFNIQFFSYTHPAYDWQKISTMVLRDPSAWYHIVAVTDTTNATAENRAIVYVNGQRVTSWSTNNNPSPNFEGYVNSSSYVTKLGRIAGFDYFDGYMAEVNFIDGLALTPNSFGTSNGLGIWQPIRYGGSYGTNGFYLPFTNPGAVTANYLVVAGGGGGGFDRGGGGGAGGLRSTVTATGGGGTLESALLLTPGQTYTITVGAGGVGETAVVANTNGSNSSISGSGITTVTSTGGGRGGGNGGAGNVNGGNGGSGGGARNNTGATGGTGTANQGFAGGSNTTNDGGPGGGGGGAGTVGKNGSPETSGRGNGGDGVATSITGSSVTYAGGGGGGGTSSFGTGGSGGGGSGASTTVNSVVGTANTGGGGGAGDDSGTYTGKAGGSGVVIISYAGTPVFTGGTITQSGGNTIHTFTSSGTLGGFNIAADYSPNGNNWTANNISLTAGSTYDSMTDVPTLTSATVANYCVINPIASAVADTYSQANLRWTKVVNTTNTTAVGSIAISSGKWYWEGTVAAAGGSNITIGIGNTDTSFVNLDSNLGMTGSTTSYAYNGLALKQNNNSQPSYGATFTTNDVIGVAFDADAGTLTFYKNNTSQGTAYTGITGTYYPACGGRLSNDSWYMNFGQRPFAYTPPTGFNRLNTFNLPTPTIGATASTLASQNFNAVTRNGYGSSGGTLACGFQPDFVWEKTRNAASSHTLWDSNRGLPKALRSDSTIEEINQTWLTGFVSNGLTFGTNDYGTGVTLVEWVWKAGQGNNVTNNSGTITSTVSANPTAGFSIVTFTGNGTGGATVGHGLGATPAFYIVKQRTVGSSTSWYCYHQYIDTSSPQNYAIYLNLPIGRDPASVFWNNTAPTSSVFSLGTSSGVNGSGGTYVAYCFAPVAGYSAFGKYTGNGISDGPFIFTGFRPKFVMFKGSSIASNWCMLDSSRNTYNVTDATLQANDPATELTNLSDVDFLSNGIKIRDVVTNDTNVSGETYIYMAFAESPFKYANAR